MPAVVMYSTGSCPYCTRARRLLDAKGVQYTEFRVDLESHYRTEMEARSRRFTVPQIFIDEHHVGGFDDLSSLNADGELDTLLGLNSSGEGR